MNATKNDLDDQLKMFIETKAHEITVVRAGDSYSWGYKDAMEDVLNYLKDAFTMRRINTKNSTPYI